MRSREFTFQLVAVARERNGKRKRKGEGGRKVEATQLAEVDLPLLLTSAIIC